MKKPIYMDHHATTPVDPSVLHAMVPYYLGGCSERAAREAVEQSRAQVARLIGAHPDEIRFTSGATESDNLAIKGVAYACRDRGNHIITCQIEHKAVLDSCGRLEREGFEVTCLPVDQYGQVDPDAVDRAITDRTILISIMHANNEVGTIHPLADIGRIAQTHGVLFHSDAVQTVGKIPVNVDALGIDLLSISAHKIYGPKGVGALYVRHRTPPIRLAPLFDGPDETNVPGIVGLGAACALCIRVMDDEAVRLVQLRERLYHGLLDRVEDVYLNGHPVHRLPGNLNMSFEFIEGGSLLLSLRDIAVSAGSACTSKTTVDPSYVLLAMGRDAALAQSAIRFGLGRRNTEEEVEYTIETIATEARKLRAMSVHYSIKHGLPTRPGVGDAETVDRHEAASSSVT